MEDKDHQLLVEIDRKVDEIREMIPHFVTWRNLGTLAVAILTLAIAWMGLS